MDKKLQEKYLEIQTINRKIQQLQQQFQNLEAQVIDIQLMKQGLDDFGKTKIGSDLLVPITPGIFINTKLTDNKELLVNVGAGVSVNKSIPETKKILDIQSEEIQNLQRNIVKDIQHLSDRGIKLEQEIKCSSS
jgi:prefoldin alpha subunit